MDPATLATIGQAAGSLIPDESGPATSGARNDSQHGGVLVEGATFGNLSLGGGTRSYAFGSRSLPTAAESIARGQAVSISNTAVLLVIVGIGLWMLISK